METVLLGLSGGVDSAVAALLLRRAGFAVHGAYLDHGVVPADAALAAARELGLPCDVVDMSAELRAEVVTPFIRAYRAGYTPNPCARCNRLVKFPLLLREADRLGARFVATGHYARTSESDNPFLQGAGLYAGRSENDQSYMLCRLTPDILARTLFPLGVYTKREVRALAAEFGLSAAAAPDSMEICFIPDGDHAAFIERESGPVEPGDFIAPDGSVAGRHRGIARYTVGMRRGLGIPAGKRLYVGRIDPDTNRIYLFEDDDMYSSELSISALNYLAPPPACPFRASVRVRHSKVRAEADIVVRGGAAALRFLSPIRRPAPGQAAACYVGDRLVLSGLIERGEVNSDL